MLNFEKFDTEMQAKLEIMFGRSNDDESPIQIIYTPYIQRPSASPVRDMDRLVVTLPSSIVSLSAGRVNIGDNGLGRASGQFNLAASINNATMSFGKSHLPYRPQRFDRVSIESEEWSVAEVMDDGGAAWSLRLNRV